MQIFLGNSTPVTAVKGGLCPNTTCWECPAIRFRARTTTQCILKEFDGFRDYKGGRENEADLLDRAAPKWQPMQTGIAAVLQDEKRQFRECG
jgi:hypothetical protein